MTYRAGLKSRRIGNVTIATWYEQEFLDPFEGMDRESAAYYRAKIARGDLYVYCGCVEVTHLPTNLKATNYLGGCVDTGNGEAMQGYISSLVSDCIIEIRRQVTAVRESTLKGF